MDNTQFTDIFNAQVERSAELLLVKAKEYANGDDRLHNFVIAGHIQNCTPAQALAGMMAKHTVSIFDMIRAGDPNQFSEDQWDEKITDHINYLILLRACIVDARVTREPEQQPLQEMVFDHFKSSIPNY